MQCMGRAVDKISLELNEMNLNEAWAPAQVERYERSL